MTEPILQEGIGGVDVRMPLDVGPEAVLRFQVEAFDESTGKRTVVRDDALKAMGEALAFAKEGAATVLKTDDAIMADVNRTPENRCKLSRETCLRIAGNVASKLDRAKQVATTILEELEASTAAPPPCKDAHEIAVMQSIVARLGQMSESERKKALDHLDIPTVRAALSVPFWVVGMLGEAEQRMLARTYRQKFHPAETERIERLRRAIGALEQSGQHFIAFVDKQTDRAAVGLARAAEERAANAIAAAQAVVGG